MRPGGIAGPHSGAAFRKKGPETAAADFTAVIDAATATGEARACARNNRADIHDDHGKTAAAIADALRC